MVDGAFKSSAEFSSAFYCFILFVRFLSPCQFTDALNTIVSRTRVIITLRSKKRENSCISSSHLRGLTTGVSSDTSVSEKDGNQ